MASNRLSILKPGRVREPLQDLSQLLPNNDEEETTTTDNHKRRVSFACVNKVKEFEVEAECTTLHQTPAYDERFSMSSDSYQSSINELPHNKSTFSSIYDSRFGDSSKILSRSRMNDENVDVVEVGLFNVSRGAPSPGKMSAGESSMDMTSIVVREDQEYVEYESNSESYYPLNLTKNRASMRVAAEPEDMDDKEVLEASSMETTEALSCIMTETIMTDFETYNQTLDVSMDETEVHESDSISMNVSMQEENVEQIQEHVTTFSKTNVQFTHDEFENVKNVDLQEDIFVKNQHMLSMNSKVQETNFIVKNTIMDKRVSTAVHSVCDEEKDVSLDESELNVSAKLLKKHVEDGNVSRKSINLMEKDPHDEILSQNSTPEENNLQVENLEKRSLSRKSIHLMEKNSHDVTLPKNSMPEENNLQVENLEKKSLSRKSINLMEKNSREILPKNSEIEESNFLVENFNKSSLSRKSINLMEKQSHYEAYSHDKTSPKNSNVEESNFQMENLKNGSLSRKSINLMEKHSHDETYSHDKTLPKNAKVKENNFSTEELIVAENNQHTEDSVVNIEKDFFPQSNETVNLEVKVHESKEKGSVTLRKSSNLENEIIETSLINVSVEDKTNLTSGKLSVHENIQIGENPVEMNEQKNLSCFQRNESAMMEDENSEMYNLHDERNSSFIKSVTLKKKNSLIDVSSNTSVAENEKKSLKENLDVDENILTVESSMFNVQKDESLFQADENIAMEEEKPVSDDVEEKVHIRSFEDVISDEKNLLLETSTVEQNIQTLKISNGEETNVQSSPEKSNENVASSRPLKRKSDSFVPETPPPEPSPKRPNTEDIDDQKNAAAPISPETKMIQEKITKALKSEITHWTIHSMTESKWIFEALWNRLQLVVTLNENDKCDSKLCFVNKDSGIGDDVLKIAIGPIIRKYRPQMNLLCAKLKDVIIFMKLTLPSIIYAENFAENFSKVIELEGITLSGGIASFLVPSFKNHLLVRIEVDVRRLEHFPSSAIKVIQHIGSIDENLVRDEFTVAGRDFDFFSKFVKNLNKRVNGTI